MPGELFRLGIDALTALERGTAPERLIEIERDDRPQPHLDAVQRDALAAAQEVHFQEVAHVMLRAGRRAGVARNDHRIAGDKQRLHELFHARRLATLQGRDALVAGADGVIHERSRLLPVNLAREIGGDAPVGETAVLGEDIPHACTDHDAGRLA